MKISDSNLNAVTTSAQQAAQTAAAAGAGRAGKTGKADGRNDHVQLSNLSNALKALLSGGPERDALISQLTASYQAGTYAVNAGAVSHSLVSDALAIR
jgi:hypothetical protein